MRLINLMANPAWLTNIFNSKKDSLLNEINLKSNLWSKDFCSLHFLISNLFQSTDTYQNQNNSSVTSLDKFKYLRIFYEEELEIDNEDDDLYCNHNFICKYSNNASHLLWKIEPLITCLNILKSVTIDKRCLFNEKIHDCESELAGKLKHYKF
jgi:hypothetical protein